MSSQLLHYRPDRTRFTGSTGKTAVCRDEIGHRVLPVDDDGYRKIAGPDCRRSEVEAGVQSVSGDPWPASIVVCAWTGVLWHRCEAMKDYVTGAISVDFEDRTVP